MVVEPSRWAKETSFSYPRLTEMRQLKLTSSSCQNYRNSTPPTAGSVVSRMEFLTWLWKTRIFTILIREIRRPYQFSSSNGIINSLQEKHGLPGLYQQLLVSLSLLHKANRIRDDTDFVFCAFDIFRSCPFNSGETFKFWVSMNYSSYCGCYRIYRHIFSNN